MRALTSVRVERNRDTLAQHLSTSLEMNGEKS